MGRYGPALFVFFGGSEEQVRQHRCSLFMGPDPLHNDRLPDKPDLLGAADLLSDMGDCPGRLV